MKKNNWKKTVVLSSTFLFATSMCLPAMAVHRTDNRTDNISVMKSKLSPTLTNISTRADNNLKVLDWKEAAGYSSITIGKSTGGTTSCFGDKITRSDATATGAEVNSAGLNKAYGEATITVADRVGIDPWTKKPNSFVATGASAISAGDYNKAYGTAALNANGGNSNDIEVIGGQVASAKTAEGKIVRSTLSYAAGDGSATNSGSFNTITSTGATIAAGAGSVKYEYYCIPKVTTTNATGSSDVINTGNVNNIAGTGAKVQSSKDSNASGTSKVTNNGNFNKITSTGAEVLSSSDSKATGASTVINNGQNFDARSTGATVFNDPSI